MSKIIKNFLGDGALSRILVDRKLLNSKNGTHRFLDKDDFRSVRFDQKRAEGILPKEKNPILGMKHLLMLGHQTAVFLVWLSPLALLSMLSALFQGFPVENSRLLYSAILLLVFFVLILTMWILRFYASRAILREGVFCSQLLIQPGSIFSSSKGNEELWLDLLLLQDAPDTEYVEDDFEVGVKALAEIVSKIKENKMPRKKLHLLLFVLGLYLVWNSLDITLAQFLAGVGLILFEILQVSLFLFSKEPIEYLKQNPRWPEYQSLINPKPVEEPKVEEVPIDRYLREEEKAKSEEPESESTEETDTAPDRYTREAE